MSYHVVFTTKEGKIEGESTVRSHEKSVEILAYKWGMSRPLTSIPGTRRAQTGAKVEPGPIVMFKQPDNASAKLMSAAAKGELFESIQISVLNAASNEILQTLTFKRAIIDSMEMTADASGKLEETLCISYAQVKHCYKLMAAADAAGAVSDAAFSFEFA